jgi:CheY-like chemotaxis protein
MTRTQLDQVFQPFVQAEVSASRRFGGTGLGLSISKSLAEAMGGSLSATSEPGKGSTFVARVRLFAHRAARGIEVATTRQREGHDAPTAPAPPLETLAAGPSTDRPLAGLSIVVVDDSALVRVVLERLLVTSGANVATAASAMEALDLLERRGASGAPDVVVMDVEMAEIDGLEATRRLRRLPGCASIPVLALTGHTDPETHERVLGAGMQACMTKPIERHELVATIARWSRPASTGKSGA